MIATPENNFSIVVPTYREAKNIPALIERIARHDFGGSAFEVIIVDDDSQDGINEIAEDMQKFYPWLKLRKRKATKSLSYSALEGFEQAQYPLLVLMDADLSHPPEKIPEMLTALKDPQVDFVIGSRYIIGGSADEIWPVARRFTSRLSALVARILISAKIKDPLSGFFALRKQTLQDSDPLRPIGWKLGLEIMMKAGCKNIKEVPIHFSQRLHGKSKLNVRVAYDYFRHVKRLMIYKFFS